MSGRRFSMTAAIGWSLTWAVGVAVGVALGAYLTVQGAGAAFGEVQLDTTELLVLPGVAAAVVFSLSMVLRLAAAGFNRMSAPREEHEPGAR